MKQKGKVFCVGQSVGGVKIISIREGRIVSTNRYSVRLLCCGKELVIGHPSMRNRERANSDGCRKCGSKNRVRSNFEKRKQKEASIDYTSAQWALSLWAAGVPAGPDRYPITMETRL